MYIAVHYSDEDNVPKHFLYTRLFELPIHLKIHFIFTRSIFSCVSAKPGERSEPPRLRVQRRGYGAGRATTTPRSSPDVPRVSGE